MEETTRLAESVQELTSEVATLRSELCVAKKDIEVSRVRRSIETKWSVILSLVVLAYFGFTSFYDIPRRITTKLDEQLSVRVEAEIAKKLGEIDAAVADALKKKEFIDGYQLQLARGEVGLRKLIVTDEIQVGLGTNGRVQLFPNKVQISDENGTTRTALAVDPNGMLNMKNLTVSDNIQVGAGPKGRVLVSPNTMELLDDNGTARVAIVVESPNISGGDTNRSYLSLMDTQRHHTVFAQATEAGEGSTAEIKLTADAEAPAAYSLQVRAANPFGPSGDMVRRFLFGKEGRITFNDGPNGGTLTADSAYGGPKWILP